jgi:hypothetical protein
MNFGCCSFETMSCAILAGNKMSFRTLITALFVMELSVHARTHTYWQTSSNKSSMILAHHQALKGTGENIAIQ